jgi:IS5 family transposase
MSASMMKPRISLFAEHEREDRRSKIGDPLVGLTKHVDFEALAATIDAAAPRPSRAKGGRPPYPTLLMVKILVLQQLYNLADDALEYQLLDRRSFLQSLELTESSSIPDAKTIWLFRDRLAQAGAGTLVFEQVQTQLQKHGYIARCGQIVDASLVQAPIQRNKREEADIVKEGTMPLDWKPHKRAQKDVDARWTKKHGKDHFGYKLHASVDKRYKLIRKLAVTNAAVADTTVFEALLDPTNTSRDVYADRGYPSIERESKLKEAGWRVHIQRRGHATKGISDTPKQRNRRIATPRARVEHVFGALSQMGGKLVRCMGIVRTTLALHLKAATYNLKRLVFLKQGGLAAF